MGIFAPSVINSEIQGYLFFAGALMFLIGVLSAAWHFWRSEAPPIVATRPDTAVERRNDRRTMLISELRDAAIAYGDGQQQGQLPFRSYLESHRQYVDIRNFLSASFIERAGRPRVAYAISIEGGLHPLASDFLDELDRIEKDWKLT